ncbi:MAG: hypothetical protein M0Z42_07525 [Actinomycetota bacterium]|nr:hypothetical protein [Actinomycetota bacterium]
MLSHPRGLHPTRQQQYLARGRRGRTAAASVLARRLVGFAALAALGFGVSTAVPVSFASAQTSAATSSEPVCTYVTNSGVRYTSISAIPAEARGTAVAMATAGSGTGYWITTDNGQTFTCNMSTTWGSWTIPGSPGTQSPVVGEAAPAGGGLYLVTASGVVAAFGAATPHGSIGTGTVLNKPIVGMAIDPATGGYWLAGADGGVFSFDAPFYGSLPAQHITPAARIVGISAMPNGGGYRLVGADGGVFDFGNAGFAGSAA